MTTIYIAGKIGQPKEGQSEQKWKEGYTKKFNYAETFIGSVLGYAVRNPIKFPHDHDRTWEAYMKECLIFMVQSDAVYALPDWAESKGATIEVELAQKLGMPVYFDMKEIPTNPIPLCNDTMF